MVLAFSLCRDASAQLIAGSEEDMLFTRVVDATGAERIELAMQFEREYPNSSVLGDVYTMVMTEYNQQNRSADAIEWGEKALRVNENNVEALIALTYNLALTQSDIPQAIAYGRQAVETIETLRAADPPLGYTPESWAQYLAALETSAESYLTYAETIR
jgi:tetratricopeptide (TPR) repeat protein